MNLNLENFLNLPQIKVVGGGQILDLYVLQLQLINEGINCPHCQKYLDVVHQSDDIIKALKRIPLAIREQVEEVCVDMWGGFPKVIRAIFPNAKIVIDRFHVQKLINKNLNKIRLKLELRGLKNKNLIMTAQSQLTKSEKTELEMLLQISPTLRIAHELKEEMMKIYNSDITPAKAIKQMKKWLASANVI